MNDPNDNYAMYERDRVDKRNAQTTTVTGERNAARVQDAMSDLLDALGFEEMAKQVKSEYDHERLCKYARWIIKNTPGPESRRLSLRNNFRLLKLA